MLAARWVWTLRMKDNLLCKNKMSLWCFILVWEDTSWFKCFTCKNTSLALMNILSTILECNGNLGRWWDHSISMFYQLCNIKAVLYIKFISTSQFMEELNSARKCLMELWCTNNLYRSHIKCLPFMMKVFMQCQLLSFVSIYLCWAKSWVANTSWDRIVLNEAWPASLAGYVIMPLLSNLSHAKKGCWKPWRNRKNNTFVY